MLRILALLLLAQWMALSPARAASSVILLELNGIIGPASKDFVLRGLESAQTRGADLAVLRMNTPGGLDNSMRDIIQAILASPVPVAVYVAPGGARAASAGTYILYASHIAAMAPATNLGAATPVQLGGGGFPSGADDAEDTNKQDDDASNDKDAESATDKQASPESAPQGTAMERKMINDARAYIRSLAQLRDRNVEWAEQAVTEAASLSAQDALEQNVIDMVAPSVADLLAQADGRSVTINGEERVLTLDDPLIETLEPDWRNRLLATITHPQVAYILMLLGIYGLFFELSNPGSLIPGVLGGICLVLALFAFQVLPVNYAGLALIILGLSFMVAEAFMPSFGILGLGGVAAFIVGSVILWDDQSGAFDVPLVLIIGLALASALIFIGVGTMAWRNRRRPPVSGDAVLLGAEGVVTETLGAQLGWIRIQGESWQARSDHALHPGAKVRVRARDGLVLTVEAEESDGD